MKLLIVLLFLFQAPKPEIRIPDLESGVQESINKQRTARDRRALVSDEMLRNLARAHSEDMAMRGYFKHVTPEGDTPMKRLDKAGYTSCKIVGENIYQANLYSRIVTNKKGNSYDWNSMEKIIGTTIKNWMDSADHRETILDEEYTRSGVGAAVAPDDKIYITQVFCAD